MKSKKYYCPSAIKNNIIPVILAGGKGSRLWPLSRKSYPKQFSKIIGDFSLFQPDPQDKQSDDRSADSNGSRRVAPAGDGAAAGGSLHARLELFHGDAARPGVPGAFLDRVGGIEGFVCRADGWIGFCLGRTEQAIVIGVELGELVGKGGYYRPFAGCTVGLAMLGRSHGKRGGRQ